MSSHCGTSSCYAMTGDCAATQTGRLHPIAPDAASATPITAFWTWRWLRRIALWLVLLLGAAILYPNPAPLHAQSWQVDLDPRPQDSFEHVAYRLWIPEGVREIKGLIVLHHGCGVGNGLRHADDLQYRALASKWDMGLVATQEWQTRADCQYWVRIERGSGDMFVNALGQLAAQSGHPEVATVPWALWGHSGGAVWVVALTARFPERVIATFARSGAFGNLNDVTGPGPVTLQVTDAMRRVPILFCYGASEEVGVFADFIRHVGEVYAMGGSNARWALAIDPVAGHENADTRYLTMRFFDSIFAQSRAVGGSAATATWRGDPRKLEIAPTTAKLVMRGDLPVSWLVSGAFARDWKEFGLTGQIRDSTPPNSPINVREHPITGGVVLDWNAMADVESGIAEFRIYGDGELLGRVASRAGVTQGGQPAAFQRWNYHDQPEEPLAETPMRFAWRGRAFNTYRVTTINHFGLESSPSAPAAP